MQAEAQAPGNGQGPGPRQFRGQGQERGRGLGHGQQQGQRSTQGPPRVAPSRNRSACRPLVPQPTDLAWIVEYLQVITLRTRRNAGTNKWALASFRLGEDIKEHLRTKHPYLMHEGLSSVPPPPKPLFIGFTKGCRKGPQLPDLGSP